MCRHLLGESAAMEALRGLDADLLFLDVAFPCGQAISGGHQLAAPACDGPQTPGRLQGAVPEPAAMVMPDAELG